VVEDVHAEQPPGADQSSRERHGVWARGRIAAWVVVRQHNRRGVCQKRGLKDLARLFCGRSYVV
jgi:hypothetical protein